LLEPPDIAVERIVAALTDDFGLRVSRIEFLPLGADNDTAVFRASDDDHIDYFVKLRGGVFNDVTVTVPHLLNTLGITQVVAPITTLCEQLWTRVDDFALLLYPFIDGQDGSERELSDQQWLQFGSTLRGVHAALIPSDIHARIPSESFTSRWRESVRAHLESIASIEPVDAAADTLISFLREQRDTIHELVSHAAKFAEMLQSRPLEYVLCHADIHAWNVLVCNDDRLYVIDWDTMKFAPRERDLMFIGAGLGGVWTSERQAELFYRGYGQIDIIPEALAYYRCDRIVEDIALYCDALLLTAEGGADRELQLGHLRSSFHPSGVVAIAIATANAL
jgi:spectinomycin phosphotransferase